MESELVSLGKTQQFDGNGLHWEEWRFQMRAYLAPTHELTTAGVDHAEAMKVQTGVAVDKAPEKNSANMYYVLTACLKEPRLTMLRSVANCSGFEFWRR